MRRLSSTLYRKQRSSRVAVRGRLPTRMARKSAQEIPSKKKNIGEKDTTRLSGTVNPLVRKVIEAKPPIAKLIGFEVVEIGDGRAIGSLQAGPQHANPMGTLHGGVLCDIADAAMGMAFASTLAPDESFTTIALSINFFRPVWQARLKAEARVINRGKSVGYLECDVTDQDGKHIARANSTCFVLRGDSAKTR
jgi:uncharacterized protein (TIGR00369 family)